MKKELLCNLLRGLAKTYKSQSLMYFHKFAKKNSFRGKLYEEIQYIFQRVKWGREEGLPLTPASQYLVFMIWRAFDLNFVMISSLATKWQDFQFHFIKQLKTEKGLAIFYLVTILWPNLIHVIISNIEKLLGVATLSPSPHCSFLRCRFFFLSSTSKHYCDPCQTFWQRM